MLKSPIARLAVSLAISAATSLTIALAQQPPSANSPQQTEAPKRARIEGSVVSVAGEPIAGANVTMTSTRPPTSPSARPSQVTSDSTGQFVFHNVDPDLEYQLAAQKEGFIPARYGAHSLNSSATPLHISAGSTLKNVVLQMSPAAAVSGKIVDENGNPAGAARVTLLRRTHQYGVPTYATGGTTTSDARGEYRVTILRAGRYYVMLSPRETPLLSKQPPTAIGPVQVTTYYPYSLDIAGATPIDVAEGAEVRAVDLRFRTGRLITLRGKAIHSATGQAAPGLMLRLSPKDDLTGIWITTRLDFGEITTHSPDGSFEVAGLSPGVYRLQNMPGAQVNGIPPPKVVGWMELSINEADADGVQDLVFPVAPGGTISGTVILEEGDVRKVLQTGASLEPPPPVLVAAAGDAGLALPALRPSVALTTSAAILNSPPTGKIQSDGSFRLENVAPGKYGLEIKGLPVEYYVKSATFGGKDVLHSQLDLTSVTSGTFRFVLSGHPAEITGTVTNSAGEPQPGRRVILWTKEADLGSRNQGVQSTYANQDGTFRFQGLAPAEYNVAAWEDLDQELAFSRILLDQFTSSAEKQKLTEGAHGSVQLKMIGTEAIKAAEAKLP